MSGIKENKKSDGEYKLYFKKNVRFYLGTIIDVNTCLTFVFYDFLSFPYNYTITLFSNNVFGIYLSLNDAESSQVVFFWVM